jgi:hypothetical protein
MLTSQISTLSKPTGANRIEPWQLAYFQARNRSRVHELVLLEFAKSGITQADLARRLNKQPAVISRLLGAPGNWGIDTVSDLLFAISGAEVAYRVQYPLDGAPQNYRSPQWLKFSEAPVASTSPASIFVQGGAPQPSAGTIVIPPSGTVTVSGTR